ncbi:MAG: hypothetical protein QOJ07_441 [Thermoleophilaceae bacterium]|nr:hypothetical protein [Thermoleophilaceae bacterium]
MAVALLVLVGVLVSTGGGDSKNGPAAGTTAAGAGHSIDPTLALAADLSAQMAEPWPAVQRDNGHYRSAVGGGTRYGDSLLGFALIQQGLRENNDKLVQSGLRGLSYAVPRAALHSRPSIFEALGIVGAYNLGRDRLAGDPTFKKLKPGLENYIRHFTLVRLPATTYYGNHWLIEAVMVQEMLRTGVRSNDPNAVVGGLRKQADRLSVDLINRRIPGFARQKGVKVGRERAFVLSDPPDDPLAYQGLSFGMYARAVRLLGARANAAARRTVLEIANASAWLTAPDGDLAYFGRNQEQAWALGATVYGAEVAAGLAKSSPAAEGRYRALAARALTRLRDAYGVGHFGLNITPGVKAGRIGGSKGVDSGAGGPSFGALTLAFVDWSLPEITAARVKPTSIRSDKPGVALLSRGESRFAVVRTRNLWYAVRVTTSGKHPEEIRNDFGLMALKQRTADGKWRDVVRLRPILHGGPDSAGPVLKRAGIPDAYPFGSTAQVSPGGTVTLTGGFRGAPKTFKREVARLPSGIVVRALDFTPGVLVRPGVTFTFAPTSCGVRYSYPAQAGDSVEYSLFLRDDKASPPKVTPTAVTDLISRTTFNRPATVKIERGFASGLDPKLIRVRLSFRALPAGPLRISVCGQAPNP